MVGVAREFLGAAPAASVGVTRLVQRIARSLFVEDREHRFERLKAFATPELPGDERPAIPPGVAA